MLSKSEPHFVDVLVLYSPQSYVTKSNQRVEL